MTSQEKLHNKIAASFNKQGFLALIGAELQDVAQGRVVIACKHQETLTQQQGLLHGGVVTSLADVSCGYAALTTMSDEAEVLAVEFKINFIRPASTKKIIATGEVIKAGKTLVIAESTVTDESGEKIIAKMLATVIVSPLK